MELCENQFISVHCGAIPDTLLESELFGHEKGAFTGAVRRKLGRFEIAQSGTIFLDEVATISASMQIKLLQVLQDKTFQRVGGEDLISADVRIISATNMDLNTMCKEGTFRKDLFYRLNVFSIEIPPLRERRDDIPILAELFLKRLNKLYIKGVRNIHPEVMEAFQCYAWPGNIRELENLIERAYILESSPILTPESFPSEIFSDSSLEARIPLVTASTLAEVRNLAVDHAERQYLKELLTRHQGKINESALEAGVGVRQLHKLLTRHGIRKEEFKTGKE